MWRRHPDNDKPDAWSDLLATLDQLVPVAEEHGVVLGIEPEHANVIDSAQRARLLLDEAELQAVANRSRWGQPVRSP